MPCSGLLRQTLNAELSDISIVSKIISCIFAAWTAVEGSPPVPRPRTLCAPQAWRRQDGSSGVNCGRNFAERFSCHPHFHSKTRSLCNVIIQSRFLSGFRQGTLFAERLTAGLRMNCFIVYCNFGKALLKHFQTAQCTRGWPRSSTRQFLKIRPKTLLRVRCTSLLLWNVQRRHYCLPLPPPALRLRRCVVRRWARTGGGHRWRACRLGHSHWGFRHCQCQRQPCSRWWLEAFAIGSFRFWSSRPLSLPVNW